MRIVSVPIVLALMLVLLSLQPPSADGGDAGRGGQGAGMCRDVEKCGCPEGLMYWPPSKSCVPDSCDKEGFKMVRDRQGKCVPKTAPCEEVGYIRNERGVCVPKPPREAGGSPGQPGKDWSKDPDVEPHLKDARKANDIWNGYYPGKGYGVTDIRFSRSGVRFGTNRPKDGPQRTEEFPVEPNPVSPDSTSSVNCTYDFRTESWTCTETSN